MAEQTQKVKVGSVTLTVYPWTHPSGKNYWRFIWYDASGKRQYTTRALKPEAIKAARAKAKEINNREIQLRDLTSKQKLMIQRFLEIDPTLAQLEEFITWRATKDIAISLHECLDKWYESQEQKGIAKISLIKDNQFRNKLKKALPNKALRDVQLEELTKWHNDEYGELAPKTFNNARNKLAGIWKWARLKGYIDDATTVAERLPTKIRRRTQPPTFNAKEAKILIANIKDKYTPWLIMCGWGCCRTEEVCPHPKSEKDPLRWSDFHWEQGIIIMRPETSKVNEKRIIPIHPIITKYLKPIAKAAPPTEKCVTALPPAYSGRNSETARLGKLLPEGKWKRNALRNSSISYRASQLGLAKTALEHGNSEKECARSYNDAMTEKDADIWYRL